jgi:hypothetical protein
MDNNDYTAALIAAGGDIAKINEILEKVKRDAEEKSARARKSEKKRKKATKKSGWVTHPEFQVERDNVWYDPFPKLVSEDDAMRFRFVPDGEEWKEIVQHDRYPVMCCPHCDVSHAKWHEIYIAGKHIRCTLCGYTTQLLPSKCTMHCLAPEGYVAIEYLEDGTEIWEADGVGCCQTRHPPLGLGISKWWYRDNPTDWNNIVPAVLPKPIYRKHSNIINIKLE